MTPPMTLTRLESDEVKVVEGGVDDYGAVNLNGRVKDNVKRGLGHGTELV